MGAFIKDEHAIAKGKVRYVGETGRGCGGRHRGDSARRPRLIEVDYEELPAVLDAGKRRLRQAPPLSTRTRPRISSRCSMPAPTATSVRAPPFRQGDIDGAWRECDLIVEGSFRPRPQAHLSLEPCGALAESMPTGRITLWSANQSVFRVQANVCESLGLPMSRLRCLTPRIGGGFGNKMEAHVQPIVVCLR